MANDLWRTPPEVFNTLNREFGFIADMASSDENALCDLNFTEEDDSLSFHWGIRLVLTARRDYVWCNPPYSDPMPWVKKALESQKSGLGVVMLLNQDTSVGWFLEALKGVSEIRNIVGDHKENGGTSSGRLDFLDENGNPAKGNNKAQFILVFNPFKIGHCVTTYVSKKYLMGS
jgi:phage N-6-adenine-methyltransferase